VELRIAGEEACLRAVLLVLVDPKGLATLVSGIDAAAR
jgi:hypothetical protein